MRFAVHSTFRDMRNGEKMLPHGLEWDLGGESVLGFLPLPVVGNDEDLLRSESEDTPSVRRAIIEAYNRWCFAKDLPFKTVCDIETLTIPPIDNSESNIHYSVKWKEIPDPQITESRLQNAEDVIKDDPSVKGDKEPAEVWINGLYSGLLKPSTLGDILQKISITPSLLLCVKRSQGAGNNIIRVERRFRGGLRKRQDIFEHVMDNLIALEDVDVLQDNEDSTIIIGSATLPDWIMGGELTSRLWIREDKKNGSILFLRPLYHDDISTSDRRFELKYGEHDEMIRLVKIEIQRLQYLARFPLPHVGLNADANSNGGQVDDTEQLVSGASLTSRERQHRRNRRRYFGI